MLLRFVVPVALLALLARSSSGGRAPVGASASQLRTRADAERARGNVRRADDLYAQADALDALDHAADILEA